MLFSKLDGKCSGELRHIFFDSKLHQQLITIQDNLVACLSESIRLLLSQQQPWGPIEVHTSLVVFHWIDLRIMQISCKVFLRKRLAFAP